MKPLLVLTIICLALMAPRLVRADSDDQDRAREAVEHHEILPLAGILAAVKRSYGSNVVDIEYEDSDGRKIYEFEIVDDKGQVIEVQVDAATGKVIGNEGAQD
ncbi:MAG: peptidase [Rhodobacteraceae bacterium]|nr:peptidase [Paracoccaceae bacterium]